MFKKRKTLASEKPNNKNAGSQSPLHPDPAPNPISRTPKTPATSTTAVATFSLKYVSLHDWWLVKAQGKDLAVGGFASREGLGVRIFYSSAIAKRHDATTLEAIDGITITINGFINRSRTFQNGFSSEICNYFLYGFPHYWEKYASQVYSEESANRGVPSRMPSLVEFNMSSGDGANTFHPVSLDDPPVTRIRDLLLSPHGDSETCVLRRSILDDLLGKFSGNEKNTPMSVHSKVKNESPVTAVDSIGDETPSNLKKAKADNEYRDDDGILDATDIRTKGFQDGGVRSKMGTIILTPIRGVATRRSIRRNKLKQSESILTRRSSSRLKNRKN